MEESAVVIEAREKHCPACWTPIIPADTFCAKCGCPLNATEQEQKNYSANRSFKEIDLDAAHKKVKQAGNALFYVAGATFVYALIGYATDTNYDSKGITLAINIILCLINVGLGLWAKNKPLPAIISGLSLFVLVLILNAFADPAYIVKGIIFKIAIIVLFINGIKSAIAAEALKKDLNI